MAAALAVAACGSGDDVAIAVAIDGVRPAVVAATIAGGTFAVQVDVRVTGNGLTGPPTLECVLTTAPPEVVPTFTGCAPVLPVDGEVDDTQSVPVDLVVAPGVPAGRYTIGFSATACAPGPADPSPGVQDLCDVADTTIVVEVTDPLASSLPTTVPGTSAPVAPVSTVPPPPAPAPTEPPPPPPAATTAPPAAAPTTAPAPVVTANLVVDPSFDVAPAIAGLPAAAGAWTGDTTALAAAGAVAPRTGASMVQFVDTGLQPSDRTETSQLWQLVDVSAYAAEIDAGAVVADGSAWFHRVVGGATTDRRFDLRVHAFDGAAADVPARYTSNSALALQSASVTIDGTAWTPAQAALALPAGTRFVLVEIYAFEDVVNDAVAPEFEGHYADDVSLTLRLS